MFRIIFSFIVCISWLCSTLELIWSSFNSSLVKLVSSTALKHILSHLIVIQYVIIVSHCKHPVCLYSEFHHHLAGSLSLRWANVILWYINNFWFYYILPFYFCINYVHEIKCLHWFEKIAFLWFFPNWADALLFATILYLFHVLPVHRLY